MLLLTAITLLAVLAFLRWRGPFFGPGFGAACFRFHLAFPGCSPPFLRGPAGSDFIGIFFRRSPRPSERNNDKMETIVPTGTQIAKQGPIAAKNNQSKIPLKTVADLMQILGANPPKQWATIQSAVAAWADYVSNLPEHRITSPSYDPTKPDNHVPTKPLKELSYELLYDEQIKKGFRPFLKADGREEHGIRTYVDHVRFVGKRCQEISREQETMPSPDWQKVLKLAKASSCFDVALHFQKLMEPNRITVLDTDTLLKKLVDEGAYYKAAWGKIVRFWRVLRDAGLNGQCPDFLDEKHQYGARFKDLPPEFKERLVALLAWLTAEWAKDRPEKKRLRPVTAAGIKVTVCTLFGFVLTKFPALTIKAVPELFIQSIIETYVEFAINERHVDGFALRMRLESLCSALRAKTKIPDSELVWFKNLMGTLPRKLDRDKISERKKRTRVDHRDLRKIPAKIRAARKSLRPGSVEYALSVRNELVIMWLLYLPWRQKNLRTMRLGTNLFKRPLQDVYEIPKWVVEEKEHDPEAEFWQINFGRNETKMKHGVVAVLPKALLGILEEYLLVRDLLVQCNQGHVDPGTLLLDDKGVMIGSHFMTDLVQTLTFRHLDIPKAINPHRFRDLFAYAWLKDNPKDFLTLSKILWHKSVQITIDTYGAEFDVASGVFATEVWSAGWVG